MEEKDFSWLHFSDLHLSAKGIENNSMREKLISFIKEQHNNGELLFDYVFITGDIANRSVYDGVHKLIKDLLGALNIKDGEIKDKVFWACGNHDIKRPADDKNESDTRCICLKKELEKINKREKTFNTIFHEGDNKNIILSTADEYYLNQESIFQRVFSPGEIRKVHHCEKLTKLNLVILNTCITSFGKRDMYNIHINSDEFAEAFDERDKSLPTFVLGHHGRDFFHYDSREALSAAFDDKNVDLYLCGHDHRVGFALFPNTKRSIYQITCGCGTNDGEAVVSFIHGKYDEKSKSIGITPFSYRDDGWGKDYRLNRRLTSENEMFPLTGRKGSQRINHVPPPGYSRPDAGTYVNILHLSDLQFGVEMGENSRGKNKEAIAHRKEAIEELPNYIKSLENDKQLDSSWKPHVVVASGDLAWNAYKDDYDKFSKWIKVLNEKLVIKEENIIVCAGNHDINREAAEKNSKFYEEDYKTNLKKIVENVRIEHPGIKLTEIELREIGLREIERAEIERAKKDLTLDNLKGVCLNFKEFINFCKGKNKAGIKIAKLKNGCNILDSEYLFGYSDVNDIRFNVLNTAWYCQNNNNKKDSRIDDRRLWIGKPLVDNLHGNAPRMYDIENDKFSITVFHHPFDWLHKEESDNDSSVKNAILDMSDVILCGHVHSKIGAPTFLKNTAQIFQSGAKWSMDDYRYETRIIRVYPATGFIKQLTIWCNQPGKGNVWDRKEDVGILNTNGYPIKYKKHAMYTNSTVLFNLQ